MKYKVVKLNGNFIGRDLTYDEALNLAHTYSRLKNEIVEIVEDEGEDSEVL